MRWAERACIRSDLLQFLLFCTGTQAETGACFDSRAQHALHFSYMQQFPDDIFPQKEGAARYCGSLMCPHLLASPACGSLPAPPSEAG